MSTPLLETKLFVPQPRGGLVPRPRLRERLRDGMSRKLMLVSAPAGFGKTTLLVDGITSASAEATAPTAWLALDAGDNDPVTFWTYVVAALRTAAPDVGAEAHALLQDRRSPAGQLLLTTLLNDLAALDEDLVLVLDDYHVIESSEVHEGMAFLLDHLPARLHLVVASRADPPLPLPRLRARGDLVEVRAADLRFTGAEAAAYLNGAMGLGLAAEDVTTLEGRTEGWIAALQLAALSMTGRDDAAAFIAGFAGDDRYVVDYLVEEVLQRQSDGVRDFLLRTSVLDRMNGSLCDALTGRPGGRATLESLDRLNLFLVPLDDRRDWYRYHHLFADVLRARLLDERPGQAEELHRRASGWYEEHGDRPEAIRHALAGGDVEGAADLVERELPALRRDRREAAIRGWLEQLPPEVLRVRPVLCNALAGARMSTGSFEGVEGLLVDAERWLPTSDGADPPAGVVVVLPEEYDRLPADLAVHRAGLALVRGDADGTVRFGRRALALASAENHLGRGAASALIGLAAWTGGDLGTAHASYTATVALFEQVDHVSDVLGCSIALADIELTRGRLRAAMRTYGRALELAAARGRPALRGSVDMYVGRAAVHLELDDLPAARSDLARARELGVPAGLPQDAYRSRVVRARLRATEGDLPAADDLLEEAERLYEGDFLPEVRPVPAVRARLWLRQGRLEEALAWVRDRGLGATDDLTYLHEFEHVTLARVLLARHAVDPDPRHLEEAVELLERLRLAAEEGDRWGSVIEIRLLLALARQRAGDLPGAHAALEAALGLAEPEGYVRTFVEEGPPLAALLRERSDRVGDTPYTRRLAAALRGEEPSAGPVAPAPGAALIEPLSAREHDVLRLLATELSGPEIAGELVVSLNTVRTHTKNVYLKLGVNNRRSAVRRARELDLL